MKYQNNPFNIRSCQANNWLGRISPENGFCRFVSFDFGLRAAVILLRNYIRKGYNTVEKIITRFAPRSENPTDSYIKYVCLGCLEPSTVITSIHSYEFFELLCKMAFFESNTILRFSDIDFVLEMFAISDV